MSFDLALAGELLELKPVVPLPIEGREVETGSCPTGAVVSSSGGFSRLCLATKHRRVPVIAVE